ncbi:MAG: hypothetical protein MZV65_00235 [Chromatiales bacterium]|nr:hypothetical protein [Chromatiales bacterium]
MGDRIRLRNNTTATARTIALRNDGIATDLEALNADLWIRADLPAPAHNIYMLSNRIGVGTTTPLYKFTVSGEGSDRSTLHFTNTGTDVGGWLTSVADNNFFVSSGASWNGAGWVQKSPGPTGRHGRLGRFRYRVMTRSRLRSRCCLPGRYPHDDRLCGNAGFGTAPIHPLHMASGAHVTAGRQLDERLEQEVQGAYRGIGP